MRYIQEWWKDLFHRKQRESDLEEELQFHLSMQEAENLRNGMSPEDARRNAILSLGGKEQVKESAREQRFGFCCEILWKDILYGIRMLWKMRAVSLISLLTLILSLGACAAILSVLNGIVLRPLPFPSPERLVQILEKNPAKGIHSSDVNAHNLQDWRLETKHLESLAAYFTMGRTLSGNQQSEVVMATQVTSDFFRVFRTRPHLGRVFTEEETKRTLYNNAVGLISPDPLVVLSHRLWLHRFGGDPGIIGKTIILDRRAWKVVGVMPAHFAIPDTRTGVWIPWGINPDSFRDQHFANGVGRLAENISMQQAEAELNRLAEALEKQFPETNQGWRVSLHPLRESIAGDFKQILWFLLAAVGVVMLIALVNIAVLQLGSASARMQESSVRMALGASRVRLVRQFLIESFLLTFGGTFLALILAHTAITALQRFQPDLPRVMEIQLDPVVILVSAAIAFLSAIFLGLAPAFVATQGSGSLFSGMNIRNATRSSTQKLRHVLVIAEVALAIVLLSCSGMLIRSFLRLENADTGFVPRNVLVLPIFLDSEKYYSGANSRAYYKELIEKLERLPNVISVGGATALPASPLGPDFQRPVWSKGEEGSDPMKLHADVRIVMPKYFKTLSIPILRGRVFDTRDTPDSAGVVMVNSSLASQVWPGEDPVGKQLVVDYSTAGTYAYEVVGVVQDVRFRGPRSIPHAEIYFPHAQRSYLVMNIAIRTRNNPELLIPSVREVLRSVDAQKPAHSISTLTDLVGATVIRDRYAMHVVGSFGLISLLLASLGIYGVLALFVRQRVQEIGIRLALGAPQRQIVGWICSQGARLLFAGVTIGLLLAVAFSRLLSGILFQISARDALSLFSASLVIIVTAFVSAWIPLRRASRVDPSTALRCD